MVQLPSGNGDYAEASAAEDPDGAWTCFGNMGFGGAGGFDGERLDQGALETQ